MGNTASSEVNNVSNTLVVNNNTLNDLNEQINNFTTNTVMKNANICGSSAYNNQNFNLSGAKFNGNLNLGITQEMSSSLDFTCMTSSTVKSGIANGIASHILNLLNSNYTTSALAKMNANAKSEQESGLGSLNFGGANSQANNTINFTNINNTHQNITNIVKNNIVNSLDLENTQSCITKAMSSQNINLADITVGGNANIQVVQNMIAKSVSSCVLNSSGTSNIVNNIMSDLGVVTHNTSETKSQSEASGESAASSKAGGVAGVFGSIIGGVFGGIKGIFSGESGSIVSSIICVVLILMAVGGYLYWKSRQEMAHTVANAAGTQIGGIIEMFVNNLLPKQQYKFVAGVL